MAFLNLETVAVRTSFSSRTPARTRGEYLKFVGVLAVIVAVSAFLFLFDAAGSALYPPCPFHLLTGLYCPGCGTLRALHQLLHGNLPQALHMNPLMVLLLPFLGYAFVSYSMQAIRRRPLTSFLLPPFWIWLLLGIVVAFAVLRNIPIHPFLLLAP